jgi:hypothetical protein
MIPKNVNRKTGRPGMELWKILVMGTIRLNCGWNYDKLKDIVDNHFSIRQMLGHPDIYDRYQYPLQTIEDNIRLFTPDILARINEVAVKAGQSIDSKKNGKDRVPMRQLRRKDGHPLSDRYQSSIRRDEENHRACCPSMRTDFIAPVA